MERNTAQRSAVLDEVKKRLDHPTAMDVYESVRQRLPNISLTTVYRNLNRLAEEGEILRITVANNPDRFDSTAREHCHVTCESCGAFFDYFDKGTERRMEKTLLDNYGFSVTKCDIVFTGICKNCQMKKTK